MKLKIGKGANRDRTITILRKFDTAATEKFGIGGREKRFKPKPITLPKLKCLEGEEPPT